MISYEKYRPRDTFLIDVLYVFNMIFESSLMMIVFKREFTTILEYYIRFFTKSLCHASNWNKSKYTPDCEVSYVGK